MPTSTIDESLCTKCGTCAEICPDDCINQEGKNSLPVLIKEEQCVSCGHCMAICPSGAFRHSEFRKSNIYPFERKKHPSAEQVLLLLKTRRSQRKFKDKPIEKNKIEMIVDGARYAPSSDNSQSTQYIVIQDKDVLYRIWEMTAQFFEKTVSQLKNPILRRVYLLFMRDEAEDAIHMLPRLEGIVKAFHEGKDMILFNSPCLLLFHGNRRLSYVDVNASLALQNAALVAETLGIGCFYAFHGCCRACC